MDTMLNDILRANGATLRQWLSTMNSLHDHVAKSFADFQTSFRAPVYRCEDCDQVEASILLHYYSFRGDALVPMTVGMVQEVARFQLGIDVTMTELKRQGAVRTQDETTLLHAQEPQQQHQQPKAECTTWRITASDPSKRWKFSPTVEMDNLIDFSQMEMPSQCPFTGRALSTASSPGGSSWDGDDDRVMRDGISYEQMQTIFPFHVLVDRQFTIIQVGHSLPTIMERTEDSFYGRHIGDVLETLSDELLSSQFQILMFQLWVTIPR